MKVQMRNAFQTITLYLKRNISILSGVALSGVLGSIIGAVTTYYSAVTYPDTENKKNLEAQLNYAERMYDDKRYVDAVETCNKIIERTTVYIRPIIYAKANKQKCKYLRYMWLEDTDRWEHLEAAIKSGNEALSALLSKEHVNERMETLYNIAMAELKISNHRDSHKHLQSSRAHLQEASNIISARSPDNIMILAIKTAQCEVQRKLSDYEEPEKNLRLALQFANDASDIVRVNQDQEMAGMISLCLGETYSDLFAATDDFTYSEIALTNLENARKYFSIDLFPGLYAAADHTIGNLKFLVYMKTKNQSDLTESIDAYKQALKLRRPGHETAKTQNNLAQALCFSTADPRSRSLGEALDHLNHALVFFRKNSNRLMHAKALMSKGMIHDAFADLSEDLSEEIFNIKQAIGFYKDAGRILTPDRNPSDHIMILNNIGELHLRLEALQKTRQALQKHPHSNFSRKVFENISKAKDMQNGSDE